MARQFLGVPASSAAGERLFSGVGQDSLSNVNARLKKHLKKSLGLGHTLRGSAKLSQVEIEIIES